MESQEFRLLSKLEWRLDLWRLGREGTFRQLRWSWKRLYLLAARSRRQCFRRRDTLRMQGAAERRSRGRRRAERNCEDGGRNNGFVDLKMLMDECYYFRRHGASLHHCEHCYYDYYYFLVVVDDYDSQKQCRIRQRCWRLRCSYYYYSFDFDGEVFFFFFARSIFLKKRKKRENFLILKKVKKVTKYKKNPELCKQ